VDEALELGGEKQIDEQDGQREDQPDRAARLLEGLALAAIADGGDLRRLRRLGLEEGQRLAQRVAGSEPAGEGDSP
jgi:hypothetical protein